MGGWSEGARRAADALLQGNGMEVRLRMPGLAAGGDEGEQLGLTTPEFTDVELGQGVLRNTNSTSRLLVSAGAVERACAGQGTLSQGAVNAASAMFAAAAGVVIGDVLYGLSAWVTMRSGDSVYAYALTLVAPTL